MTPIDKLIAMINPELCYTLSDLSAKCKKAGFHVPKEKLRSDIRLGRLQTVQFGKGSMHQVQGSFFLAYIIERAAN